MYAIVHVAMETTKTSSVYFSLAKIWQMTYAHKLPKLCSATLNLFREAVVGNLVLQIRRQEIWVRKHQLLI